MEKGKVLATTGETREGEPSLEGGWLLLVTLEQFLLPLESLEEHRLDHPAKHLLLHAIELYPSQSIYFLLQIYLSWTELGVLYLNKDWIFAQQPPLFPI